MLFCYFFVSIAIFRAHSVWCAENVKERYSLPISSNNNAYGTGGNSNTAQAIPLTALVPPTLAQLYGANSQIAFSLDFAQQPYRWDPYSRLNQSEFIWRFADTNDTLPADNAYIELTGSSSSSSNPYEPYKDNKRKAALLSAPFQRWRPLNDSSPLYTSSFNEGVLAWKKTVTVGATQRILLSFRASCKIYGAENHPFPASLVSHSDDDPRLANCFIYFPPTNPNVTSDIYILITNKSIWGVYETFPSSINSISKRRIGIRHSYNDIVDVGLEYNAMLNHYTFYVSGQPVWTITQPGLLPPQDGVTKTDIGNGIAAVSAPVSTFTLIFGTHKCLDESDSWNQADKTRLVRVTDDTDLYGNSIFYDENDLRSNNLWGQTVKMTLYDASIKTASAVVQPAPAVVQQEEQNSEGYNNVNNNYYEK